MVMAMAMAMICRSKLGVNLELFCFRSSSAISTTINVSSRSSSRMTRRSGEDDDDDDVDCAAAESLSIGAGKHLLSLILSNQSAVIGINRWIEEQQQQHNSSLLLLPRKYQLNRIVRELRSIRRYKHALEICEWMTIRKDLKLLPGDYAVHLDLIAKVRGLASAEKFFQDLPEKMKNLPTYTSLLHTYVQHKLLEKAEFVMGKIVSSKGFLKDPIPYNHMMSLYITVGKLEKVPLVIQQLRMNSSPDLYTYNLWLRSCAVSGDWEGAETVYRELKHMKINADWVTYSTLASTYIKVDLVYKAVLALSEMELRIGQKDRQAYCSLITLHSSLGRKGDVYRIWMSMKTRFRKMSNFEYSCMISSLVKLDDAEEAVKIYYEWESVAANCDVQIPNIILGAFVREGLLQKAEQFFEHFSCKGIKPSSRTWEILALAYLKELKMDKALSSLRKAITCVKKWEPKSEVIQNVFIQLEKLGDVENAEKMLSILRDARCLSPIIYNSLLRTYAKAGMVPARIIERMAEDNVVPDEETNRLLKVTNKPLVRKSLV